MTWVIYRNFIISRFKNGKELRNGRIVSTTDGDKVTMTIKESEINDMGVFRCEASNKLGRVETQCNVEVHGMYD